jgi:hypothetical protein
MLWELWCPHCRSHRIVPYLRHCAAHVATCRASNFEGSCYSRGNRIDSCGPPAISTVVAQSLFVEPTKREEVPQMERKPRKVLTRIGHCRAYELVRVWGCPSLSHLLSASAFNGAFGVSGPLSGRTRRNYFCLAGLLAKEEDRLSTGLQPGAGWPPRKAEPLLAAQRPPTPNGGPILPAGPKSIESHILEWA